MKKILLLGMLVILIMPLSSLLDWAYYRDRAPFISPILHTGELPIRADTYGDGRFGAKRKGGRRHKGLDICAALRTNVIASKGGRARVGFQKNGMGKYIIIRHPAGYSTLYGHLDEYAVENKDRTRQGEVIGYVGKTGNARARRIKPHLHFEIRRSGQYFDPLLFIK